VRLLAIRLSAIGDVAVTANVVYALKKALPDVEIDWLVEEEAASLVESFPFVDRVLSLRRRKYVRSLLYNPVRLFGLPLATAAMVRRIRKGAHDVLLDFQGNFRSGVLSFLSGAKKRVGFSAGRVYEASHMFYTTKVRLPKSPLHRVERMCRLAAEVVEGLRVETHPVPLDFRDGDRVVVDRFLYEQRAFSRPVAVVHPGVSRFGEFKRWSLVKFARLSRLLASELGLFVVVTWAGDEWFYAVEMVKESGGGVVVAPELKNLRQLAYLLSRASLFVGGDTGPLHIAALLQTPSVAIFGPKDPEVYRPWNKNAVVVRGDVECSPCSRRRCTERKCMDAVSVEMVFEAAKELLSQCEFARSGEGE